MTKNIEVELRGPLDEDSNKKLIEYLDESGEFVDEQNRFLVDYSTFLEGVSGRKSDIRARITNGEVELIVKKGTFGGHAREEVSVFIEGGNLKNALAFMAMLGYKKGITAHKSIKKYNIDGIEITIHEMKKCNNPHQIHSRFFEAEIMADQNSKQEAIDKISKFIGELGLSIFEKEDFYEYIRKLNIEANGVFDYEKDNLNAIINLIS
ncbi:MAG: hypothetical protein KAI57_01160 [Candidatus Pacebacteria bacterium]|nr:hypothetical protein [Candidatus Paceibacterota bacterium]